MALTNEIKYRLLAGRLERDYANSPDAGLSFGPRKVHVNLDHVHECSRHYSRNRTDETVHLFAFGAHGCTFVLAFGSLEDALEDAAATLKEVAPGCFVEPDYTDSIADMVRDGELPADYTVARFEAEWCEGNEHVSAIWDHAQDDLTYTESGWLASWGWTIVGSGMSPEEIRAWAKNER